MQIIVTQIRCKFYVDGEDKVDTYYANYSDPNKM